MNPLNENSTVNCTVEERARVMEYSLAVQILEFIVDYDAVADSGIVSVLNLVCVFLTFDYKHSLRIYTLSLEMGNADVPI